MTNEEAKFILGAVRPGHIDPSDPDLAEALRLAGTDPELNAWFARSTAFDTVVADRLRGIAPPDDLKATILAGVRVSRRPARRFPLGRVLLAMAALLAISLVATRFLPVSPVTPPISGEQILAGFRSDMLREIENLQQIDYVSNDPDKVAKWLRENEAAPDFEIPSDTGGHRLVGCKVLLWKGHRVSLICFTNPNADGPPGLHLVTLSADALPDFDASAEAFHREGEWSTSAWREGDSIHILAAKGEHRDLRQRLPLG